MANEFIARNGLTAQNNSTISGSFSQGFESTVLGLYSHAEGSNTIAAGAYSHAEGVGYQITTGIKVSIVSASYVHIQIPGSNNIVFSNPYNFTTSSATWYSGYNTIAGATFPATPTYIYIQSASQGTTLNPNYYNLTNFITSGSYVGGAVTLFFTSGTLSRVFNYIEGTGNPAIGIGSHTEGQFTKANGSYSHAEGYTTTANGYASHVEGSSTFANGGYSHAEGTNTNANGQSSHAEGYATTANGFYSHAEGLSTTANGNWSHAEGAYGSANGLYSHVEGIGSSASGEASHAEGSSTIASGSYSHAEGIGTIANQKYAHAEGKYTQGIGYASHAEGEYTYANGDYSHAEGYSTNANGFYSHAEGESTTANGYASHAEGYQTNALGNYQHVQGQYNISSSIQSAFIVGNGTGPDSLRSNLIFAAGLEVQITGSLITSEKISIGTGTNIASSKLTVQSTTQGFLPPRMTNAQRIAIVTPAVGLCVYCTDVVEGLYINKSTGWEYIG